MGTAPWPPGVQRLGDMFVGFLVLFAPLWIGWQLHTSGGEVPTWVADVGPMAQEWWAEWMTVVGD